MIIFLYGSDTYRSREELRKIIQESKKTNPDWFDFVRIDAGDKEMEVFKELRQTTDTASMFSQKKLVVIENIFSANKDIREEVLEFLKSKALEKDKDLEIIFWDDETDAREEFFRYLKTKAECREFKPLQGVQLKSWIKKYIAEAGGAIESQALDKLTEWIGGDLWRMANEINKLLNYNKNIKLENVELLVSPEIDLNIFKMVDAIGYKDKVMAIKLFSQHIESGADEYYLLSMFIYQFRNLIKIKTAKSIKSLGMKPFVEHKSIQQARNFSFEELKKIYCQLMTIDLEAKIGKTEIRAALELFLSGL